MNRYVNEKTVKVNVEGARPSVDQMMAQTTNTKRSTTEASGRALLVEGRANQLTVLQRMSASSSGNAL